VITEAENRARTTAEATANEEIARSVRDQQRAAQAAREATIADLIRTSRRLTQEARYREALGVIDQILVLDPNNDYAVGVRPLVLDKVQIREQRDLRERLDRELVDTYNRAEEAKIPYDDILRYPTDWPDISALRDQTVASERGEDREDRIVQAQLERQIPETPFDGTPLTDVVDYLRDITNANIFVNWRALEAGGIDRNTPVTAKLRNVRSPRPCRSSSTASAATRPPGLHDRRRRHHDQHRRGPGKEHADPRLRHPRPHHRHPRLHRRPRTSASAELRLRRRRGRRRGRRGGGGGGLFGDSNSSGNEEEEGSKTPARS
jgi:hypothetical protein